MDWRFLAVVVGASILASVTDWLFMGVLFHKQYQHAPEIWRTHPQLTGTRRIVYSQIIGLITCAAFAYLCLTLDALTVPSALTVALLVWVAGAVVILGQMVMWVKLHPLVGVSHALGWLARLVITALLAVWIMGPKAGLLPTPL
jgi:uncharacterized membrane protein